MCVQYSSCLTAAHLPGLTAPPAGIGGDVQPPTAGLPGQKGELSDGTADETPQVDGRHSWLQRDAEQNQQHQARTPESERATQRYNKTSASFYRNWLLEEGSWALTSEVNTEGL